MEILDTHDSPVPFPSPCGEKVGINHAKCARGDCEPLWVVSVPLRGKGRDQRDSCPLFRIRGLAAFSSPCGEKVGINGRDALSRLGGLSSHVSVPLRGKGRDQQLFLLSGSDV